MQICICKSILAGQRGLESMARDYDYKKKSPKNKLWNLSICNKLGQIMVREIDSAWNTLQTSVELMYQKLRDLGFRIEDGKIIKPG